MKKVVLFISLIHSVGFVFSQRRTVTENLLNNVGDTVVVSGRIYNGTYLIHVNTKPTFLNLGDTSPHHRLILRIEPEDRDKFPTPPEVFYLNKIVEVSGKLEDYKGTPLIKITQPEMIRTLPNLMDSVNARTNTYTIVARSDSNRSSPFSTEPVHINPELHATKPDSVMQTNWLKSVSDKAAEEKSTNVWLVNKATDLKTAPFSDAPVIARIPVGVLISVLYTSKKWSFITISSIDGFHNVNGFIRHRRFRHLKKVTADKNINAKN